MQNITNEFIKPIVMKRKKHDFKAWIEYRKIIKKCNKLSPSFNQICEISDFLNILRESYMYGNSDSFHLFLGVLPRNHTKLDSCSVFYKDKDKFSIGFILLKETRTINIEIERRGQNIKSEKEHISFVEGEYKFKDIYDQEKFLFITSCLMDGVVELIEYYYKNKRF